MDIKHLDLNFYFPPPKSRCSTFYFPQQEINICFVILFFILSNDKYYNNFLPDLTMARE